MLGFASIDGHVMKAISLGAVGELHGDVLLVFGQDADHVAAAILGAAGESGVAV